MDGGQVNLAEAKAHLSGPVTRAEASETIQISRRGKPVVQLGRLTQPRKPIQLAELGAVTDTMTKSTTENVVRAIRDEVRHWYDISTLRADLPTSIGLDCERVMRCTSRSRPTMEPS
jgi:antitoxin (DNA-binding transcriptional repressor) of toxin-antitoxin stability system